MLRTAFVVILSAAKDPRILPAHSTNVSSRPESALLRTQWRDPHVGPATFSTTKDLLLPTLHKRVISTGVRAFADAVERPAYRPRHILNNEHSLEICHAEREADVRATHYSAPTNPSTLLMHDNIVPAIATFPAIAVICFFTVSSSVFVVLICVCSAVNSAVFAWM
jgi:hypothetical protein